MLCSASLLKFIVSEVMLEAPEATSPHADSLSDEARLISVARITKTSARFEFFLSA